MASKFLVTDIVDPVKAPITEIGLRHINAMSQEVGDALVKALVGTYTTNDLIILSGCVVTVLSGSVPGTGTASLSAGYVYRNGEVFAVDAIASIATTANTLVWVADDELRDSVQTKFSDANDYDFLRVAKLKLQAGASGSGLNDFDAATVKDVNYFLYSTDALNGSLSDGSSGATLALDSGTDLVISKLGRTVNISGCVVVTVPSGAVATTLNGLSNYTLTIPLPTGFVPKQISGANSRGLVWVQLNDTFTTAAVKMGRLIAAATGVGLFLPNAFNGYTVLNGDQFVIRFTGSYETN